MGFWLACARALHADQALPVFLSDNHAETFGWISRTFDPEDRYQLVLVDAHSDASMAERSEEIREGLRRVPSEAARAENVEKWRAGGRIQAFNWIEPLIPRPIERVIWLAAPELTTEQSAAKTMDAVESLDGRLEVEPRPAGSFEGRWQTVGLADFVKWDPEGAPVILTIDLDFFAGMEAATRERAFETIWTEALDWPNLAGVAFSVSRPWLLNDAEADALVALACDAVLRTRGAVLEIDASLDDRPDRSKKAMESDNPVARWNAEGISAVNRLRWCQLGGRLRITDRKRSWKPVFDARCEGLVIRPDQGEEDCDGVWRFSLAERPVLRVDGPAGATGRVRWFVLEPARHAYDLIPETGLGKSFSRNPGRWICETRTSLGSTEDFAFPAERWKPKGFGRVRITAEVETPEGWLPTAPVDIRFHQGTGFRGALSECFGMPYAFGIAGVDDDDRTGADSGWGSDCSNFLIYAWRRNGLPLRWGDPGRLRAQLATKAEPVTLDDHPAVSGEEIGRGVALDFGNHVAALWEDRDPKGVLDGGDLVAHHLGGLPEIVPLAELTKTRPRFALRVPVESGHRVSIRIAGDVVLAGGESVAAPGFGKQDADLFLVNLEGTPSLLDPRKAGPFDFRFGPEHLQTLKAWSVDAVSLANNHAGDAGREGLLESLARLRAAGIGFCGAGKNSAEACEPWRSTRNGVRVAVFGACVVDALGATEDAPGVARLPDHSGLLEAGIRRAVLDCESVVVLLHGGDEYRSTVNDDQRRWARWFANLGVSVVAGSHPHVVQRSEVFAGTRIVHSLGNAVYPKSLKGADSGEVRTFSIDAR